MNDTTLISLASRQTWPQILTALYLRPARLVLLHSADEAESEGPARHLRKFFGKVGVLASREVLLREIPHDDFEAIESGLDALQAGLGVPMGQCVLNLTGGNKLMSSAAFRWALRRSVKACYLERGNELTWFLPRDGDVVTSREALDGHLADGFDPADLLACQMAASEIERKGQLVVLNEEGQRVREAELWQRLDNGMDARHYLDLSGEADARDAEGDRLEFATAAVLLKLGVRQVRRSLRLKVRSKLGVGTRLPHAEIDLLFTWNGRLWLVDCKDRKPVEHLTRRFRKWLNSQGVAPEPEARKLFDDIEGQLTVSRTKVFKEDLAAIRELGGLLGQVVAVRREDMDAEAPEAAEFARRNNIAVVRKAHMMRELGNLLHPDRPATAEELASLRQ